MLTNCRKKETNIIDQQIDQLEMGFKGKFMASDFNIHMGKRGIRIELTKKLGTYF